MGDKLQSMKTTSELPEEVIREEILRRLPIKSLVRFKCVSKSWLSLLSNPQFVKQHHTHNATQNPNDNDCLIAKNDNTKIVIVSRYKKEFLLITDRYYQLVGSVNGLVCVRCDNKLSLWNPAIHQSKELTFPPNRDMVLIRNGIGFGFDPVSNDYKVVVVSDDFRSAIVYYSSSDSWIDILVPDDVFPKNIESRPSTIVKDCPYWIFSSYLYNLKTVSFIAVKFNAGSNEFKLLPEFCYTSLHGNRYPFDYIFLDMNDRLSLMVHDRYSSNCMADIYSLEEEEEGCCVWRKMCTVGLNFLMGGSYYTLSQGFKYGGEIFLNNGGKFYCYDHTTNTMKPLDGTAEFFSVSCFRYTPSLIFLQGMKSVHLTTQTRRRGLRSRTPRRLISSITPLRLIGS